ncbi:MAG TPA: pitrilysin family protein [Kofleriaceae bacterium]|nr:pitrilysin family protein [Kofleriaceae bacterium]
MSKTSWRLLVLALAGLAFLACGGSETPRFVFNSPEQRGVLEANGIRFVIMPDPTTQLAQLDIRYDVGSREDPNGKAGLAHLVEHLMFQVRPDGPETAPIFQTIIQLSTNFNAYTEWDRTHYWMTSRAENLDSMLKVEAMRMFYAADLPPFGCSTLDEREFEREREVVRNEIRAQSSADNYVLQLVEAAMYPPGHAYQRLVGGNDEQIASASLKDACEFMKKYYAPQRALIVIAGNVDVNQTVEMIKHWFGKIPPRTPAPRVAVAPFQTHHTTTTIEADVDRPAVWIGWALPARNTPEGEAASFGIGAAWARIAQKGQDYDFAYSVEPAVLGGQLAPLFLLRIELKGMDKLDEALDFAEKGARQAYRSYESTIVDASQQLQESEYLQEDKNKAKAAFIEELQRLPARTEAVADLVQFSRDFDFNSSDRYLYHQLDKIDKYDSGMVATQVKAALDWDKAAIVIVKPNKEGIQGDTRSRVKYDGKSDPGMTDPQVDPREAVHPVKVSTELKVLESAQRFTLPNGMEVVLMPVETPIPAMSASIMFKNAGDASTPNDPALAAMAAQFLQRVPDIDPQLTRQTDVFSRTGIEVECGSTEDAAFCSTHGMNMYLEVMVRGLERMISAGVYSQDHVEHWQKEVKEDWKLPTYQAQAEYVRQVYTALYGPDHPYTRTVLITPDAAGKLHSDALDHFRREHYTAGNATLVLAGNFDAKRAESLIRSTFGSWGKGRVDPPVPSTLYRRTGPEFVGVTRPKVDQQVTVTIAYPSPAGIDGQEAAREVLAEMLNIRSQDVRFKLGSTYGLYMMRQAHKGPSAYIMRGGAVIGGTIDAERAGESIKALRDSFDALRKGDQFDEHFVRARRKILSQLLVESTVSDELAQRLDRISLYALKPSYYNTLLQQVAAVSPAQVRALIQTELDPNNEVVVVLADKAHLDKTFADAGIKDVKIVEPEYK